MVGSIDPTQRASLNKDQEEAIDKRRTEEKIKHMQSLLVP